MAAKFLGKDPGSPDGDSPSLWDDGDSFVMQGWRVTDPSEVAALLAAAGQGSVPGHETLIRFPKRMMALFPEVNGRGEGPAGR
ncbi:MAG TPA: hypothetical protein VGS19_06360 [Streptosporangiaceae bacterium]|nr:hypothetical protein [Streptosporangiaceae bacterium]